MQTYPRKVSLHNTHRYFQIYTISALLLLLILIIIFSLSNPYNTASPVVTANAGLLELHYANQELQGSPTLTQLSGSIDFSRPSNTASLAEQQPISIRWQGFVTPRFSELYTFISRSDDGVRLWVNGQLLINNWTIHAVTEDRSTITLEAGIAYPIVIEYFDRGLDAMMQLKWSSLSEPQALIPASAFTPPVGLVSKHFANIDVAGPPVHQQIDPQIDLAWNIDEQPFAHLKAPLSIRWQGLIRAPSSEIYTFMTTSDDGVRLWVDGQLLIDNWTVHAVAEDQASIELQKDQLYPVVLEFFDRGYHGVIRLEWSTPNKPRELVAGRYLVHNPFDLEAIDSYPDDNYTVVYNPVTLPLTAIELVNPSRGLYKWRGHETVPSPYPLSRPAFDMYERYSWRDLEPVLGRYNFSRIERDLNRAKREGRKLSFRVRALIATQSVQVPEYMMTQMERGWWHDYNKDGINDTYVPDWNDPDFLKRTRALLEALGARYKDDPRVAMIDVGMYGDWGEWHMWNYPYPSPTGAQNMTQRAREELIDIHIAAFPTKRLLMLTEDERTLVYALRKSPTMGWRRDSFGAPHFSNLWTELERNHGAAGLKLVAERWKTAPVVVEFINPAHPDRPAAPEVYRLGQRQVVEYHISMIGNGNTDEWSALSDESKEAFVAMAKAGGYRLELSAIKLSSVRTGASLRVHTAWRNVGNAPLYDPWDVAIRLRSVVDQTIAWESDLKINLQQVLPIAEQALFEYSESLNLPSTLAAGQYSFELIVRDPKGYYEPLTLAIEGRAADGAYILGQITVGS